jgi:hypothetical protein
MNILHSSPTRVSSFLAAGLLVLSASVGSSETNDVLTVVVRDGQSLRDIAEEYFGDPNLWQELLRVNGLSSADGIAAGMKLNVPRTEITLANQALIEALAVIQKATEAGGRVFAPELLESAVQARGEALGLRRKSDWSGCQKAALRASADAGKALEITRDKRNAKTEAVLRTFAGTVESRKTSDLVWKAAGRGALLEEMEKVRTLSDSTADILFVDESRIRLVPNSQAVIQTMRIDPLKNRQDASISLVEGDVYALLAGAGKGKGVNVAVGGITTESSSTDFWVSRQGEKTKYANYDEQRMEISSGGTTVTLRKNQGTVVEAGKSPSVVRDLLPAPVPVEPKDDALHLGKEEPRLSWSEVAGAVRYQLEAASDPSFRTVVVTRSRITAPESGLGDLEDGIYYWRVSAIDDLGFPGAKSEARRFRILRRTAAPYLAVRAPLEGAILRTGTAVIEGEVAKRVSLKINDQPVDVGANGAFRAEQPLEEGENTISFRLAGESGDVAEVARHVVYMPDRPALIEYSSKLTTNGPKRFVTNEATFLLEGRTTPEARIEIPDQASVFTDESGQFRIPLPTPVDQQEYVLRVIAPSAFVTEDRFAIERDTDPPDLRVHPNPPAVTSDNVVVIEGTLGGASRLVLNGDEIPFTGSRFQARLDLEPGPNRVEVVALDPVGNEKRWIRTITLDTAPPKLVDLSVSRKTGGPGDTIEVTVRAKDETDMKRLALVHIQVGEWSENVSLDLDPSDGTYRGAVRLPHDAQGKVVLKHVVLEDYLGNKETYSPR